MPSNFLFTQFPASRSVIENELRLSFWRAGFKRMWFTCTKDTAPFECSAVWNDKEFAVEWEPQNYLLLKMERVDEELLKAFKNVLGHAALAAYKNGGGHVVVEWRVKDAEARFNELQSAGVGELQRLAK